MIRSVLVRVPFPGPAALLLEHWWVASLDSSERVRRLTVFHFLNYSDRILQAFDASKPFEVADDPPFLLLDISVSVPSPLTLSLIECSAIGLDSSVR